MGGGDREGLEMQEGEGGHTDQKGKRTRDRRDGGGRKRWGKERREEAGRQRRREMSTAWRDDQVSSRAQTGRAKGIRRPGDHTNYGVASIIFRENLEKNGVCSPINKKKKTKTWVLEA